MGIEKGEHSPGSESKRLSWLARVSAVARFNCSPWSYRKLALFLFLFLMYTKTIQAVDPRSLTFGIVPQQSASKLAKNWIPILTYISKKTGYQVIFQTAPSIPDFERRLAAGLYDMAYMNPYHYTVFSIRPGYQAFAKQRDKEIRGVIVVRKDSPLQELKDLQGLEVAFPSPAAFAASILPQIYCKQSGIEITPKYVNSHDSVYLNVDMGLYPAGGGVVQTLNNMSQPVRDRLRVLWKTDAFTPHAFAVRPDIPRKMTEDVLLALIAMSDDREVQPLLKAVNFNGFETASDNDWDDVRALRLEDHVVPVTDVGSTMSDDTIPSDK